MKYEKALSFTLGNRKIGKDTLIFNMGPAMTCPSAIAGLCKLAPKKFGGSAKCYALKAERLYPNSRKFRAIQEIQWKTIPAIEYADQFFAEIYKRKNLINAIKFIRFNESGDFHSEDCIKKLVQIVKLLTELCDLHNLETPKFFGYTHRQDLFLGFNFKNLPENLTINGSGFMLQNEFRVLPISRSIRDNRTNGKKDFQYTCLDDCSLCSLCKTSKNIVIIQSLH